MLNARIEPTFDHTDPQSVKPGEIRIISVDEYKKQIEAARKDGAKTDNAQSWNDESYQYARPEKSGWKKILGATVGIALVSLNIALLYVELQPKMLKPTVSIATPWGTAEVLTPWGTDEPSKIAQLSVGVKRMPVIEKENKAESANVGFYDK